MKLLTEELRAKLLANGAASKASEGGIDHIPVVKFFTPWGGATWLISEADPDDPDVLFGLCDLGMGDPELGYVLFSELCSIRGPVGLTVERDLYFKPNRTVSAYADEARLAGMILT